MIIPSLAGPPLRIESKGLVQRKHSTRFLLQKYCSPIRLQPCDLAHAFPFRHRSKNGGERSLLNYLCYTIFLQATAEFNDFLLLLLSLVSSLHPKQRHYVAMIQCRGGGWDCNEKLARGKNWPGGPFFLSPKLDPRDQKRSSW